MDHQLDVAVHTALNSPRTIAGPTPAYDIQTQCRFVRRRWCEKRWWLCISARAKEGRIALLQGRHALYKSNIARIHISQRDFFMQQRGDLRFPLSLLSAVLTRNTRVWLRNFHFGLACRSWPHLWPCCSVHAFLMTHFSQNFRCWYDTSSPSSFSKSTLSM